MTAVPAEADPFEAAGDRVIGRVAAARPGPLLIGVGGMHGNEPAGVAALRRIVRSLHETGLDRGDLLAVSGNLAALARGTRFVARDLNRHWRPDHFRHLGDAPTAPSEDHEQREIARVLRDAFDRARGPVFLLDLHTTSGPSKPFTVIADSLPSRRFALAFPNPLVLGLEEHLDGTLVDVVANLGHAALAFEGGQNTDPQSVDATEAAVWWALAEVGLLDGRAPDRVAAARRALRRAAAGLPAVVEIRHRHAVTAGDGFGMAAGCRGFDRVRPGQRLGRDDTGPLTAPRRGFLLMPLYQRQGDDGFFITTRVRRGWLLVSAALRGLGVDRIVHWLPGIARDLDDPRAVVVNRRTARYLALEVLHLLGFRRVRETPTTLHLRRRGLPPRA